MAFFVENHRRLQGKTKGENNLGRIDLIILALGKKSGLSFGEMNELRMADFISLVRMINETDDGAGEEKKMATQEDIDEFFA